MTEADRVLFLMQPPARTAFKAIVPNQEDRDAIIRESLAEYKNAYLAAVSVLEMLCDSFRLLAADTAAAATKSITVGPIKIEKAQLERAGDDVKADVFCARAAALRREYRRRFGGGIQLATPLHIPRVVTE